MAFHLMKALGEVVTLAGHGRVPREPTEQLPLPPHIEITPTASSVTSSLRIVLLEDAVLVFVTGANPVDEKSLVEPWLKALRLASERLGKSTETFEWDSIVGPAPGALADTRAALEATTKVGPLTLIPGGTHLYESVPQGMPSLWGRGGFGSWPVVVTGESEGFNWYVAGAAASRDLRRLCGILSVAWDVPWTLRQAPRHPIERLITLPAVSPWEPHQDNLSVPSEPDRILEVPAWGSDAWERLDSDIELEAAAAAHLEGWLMLPNHPSYALIAFIGAIEGIGARYVDLERCKVCGGTTGSGRRFRTALSLVRSGDDFKELAGLYTRRSKTAHSGHLHGPELVFDFLEYPAAFGSDPAWDFAYRQVSRMQRACRDLLELALPGRLPSRSELDADL